MKPLFPSISHNTSRKVPTIGSKATKRPSASKRGYTAAWRRRRKKHLVLHPWCEDCLELGLKVKATDVDHVRPLAGGGADDDSNYRSRCHSHHSSKTCRADGGFGNRKKTH